jgi:hypothetical protein
MGGGVQEVERPDVNAMRKALKSPSITMTAQKARPGFRRKRLGIGSSP